MKCTRAFRIILRLSLKFNLENALIISLTQLKIEKYCMSESLNGTGTPILSTFRSSTQRSVEVA